MSDDMLLMAVFLVVSVAVTGLSLPLMLKLVAPNWLYGFRTRTTVGNPEIWYAVNQLTGVWMFVTGQVLSATTLWTHAAQLNVDARAWIILGAFTAGITATIIHGSLVIRRLKRELGKPSAN